MNAINTSQPNVETLLGSSPSTGEPPTFQPIGSPAEAAEVPDPYGSLDVPALRERYETATERLFAAIREEAASNERLVIPERSARLEITALDRWLFGDNIFGKTVEGKYHCYHVTVDKLKEKRSSFVVDNHNDAQKVEAQLARCDDLIETWEAWQADMEAAEEASGCTASRSERNAAWDEHTEIRWSIITRESKDPALHDLKVQAYVDLLLLDEKDADAAIQDVLDSEGPSEAAFAMSIVADLIQMAQATKEARQEAA